MALENRAQKAKREAMEALPRIVQATLEAEPGYTFCTAEIVAYLSKNGLAEGNEEITNDAGAIACRATQKGVNLIKEQEGEKVSEEVVKVEFVIEDGIEMPESKRSGRVGNVGSKYPFDQLGVNQSFAVPGATAKTFAGTVSSANKRYAKEVEGQTRTNRKGAVVPVTVQEREFKLRAIEGGVRVWRVK